MRHKLFLYFVSILVLITLAGCTSKMSYRYLDWIIEWQVDDYIQWNNSQQKEFDQRLANLLDWHQRSELPKYSQWLKLLQEDLTQPLSTSQLEQYSEHLGSFWTNLMGRVVIDTTVLLAQLDEAQVKELVETLESDISKSEKKYKKRGREQLDKKRLANVIKSSKRWLGALTPEQKQLAMQWNQRHQHSWPLWLESRRVWVSEFETALYSRKEQNFEKNINQLFVHSSSFRSPEYREIMQVNTTNTMMFIIELHKTLTQKQQRHLSREITKLTTVFDELAEEKPD